MTTYVRPYSEVSAAIAYASSVNRYIDDFASTINNLNSNNLLASAIGTTQIETCAVTTVKIANSAVGNAALGDLAVDADKLDGEARFFGEVFN